MHNKTIAFIGTGTMGAGIIKNLQRKGYFFRLYNRTPEKAIRLARSQDTVCNTPAEAALGANIVMASVTDDRASQHVWFGTAGIINTIKTDTVCIEFSTLSLPYTTQWIQKLRKKKLRPVDCPATGSRGGAETATLSLFLGGRKKDIDEMENVWSAISRQRFYFGSSGSGMKFKLIYNMLGGTILVAFAEALGLAQGLGLTMKDVLAAFQTNRQGWSGPVANSKGADMLNHKHTAINCRLDIMVKDLSYAIDSSKNVQKTLAVSLAALDMLIKADRKKLGHLDMSAVGDLFIK